MSHFHLIYTKSAHYNTQVPGKAKLLHSTLYTHTTKVCTSKKCVIHFQNKGSKITRNFNENVFSNGKNAF